MLKEAPDVVRLKTCLLCARQQNLLPQPRIVLFGIRVEGSHLVAADEAVFLAIVVEENLEHAFPLIVVNLWLVCELEIDANVRGCRRMHMVEATLGHLLENTVQLSLFEPFLDFVEVVDNDVVQGCDQLLLHLSQLSVGFFLLSRRFALLVV